MQPATKKSRPHVDVIDYLYGLELQLQQQDLRPSYLKVRLQIPFPCSVGPLQMLDTERKSSLSIHLFY